MQSKTTATIDLSALRHNYLQVKSLAPQSKIMSVIKANGYGHGLTAVAETLRDSDSLAVARLTEAEMLRNHGLSIPVLVLSDHLTADDLAYCADRNIDIVLHSPDSAALLQRIKLASPINVWFKFDSGMHRLGLDADSLQHAVNELSHSGNVNRIGYLTHFDCAEEPDTSRSLEQLRLLNTAIQGLPAAATSVSNSAAIIRGLAKDTDWVRPGIMLYGANPLAPALHDTHPVDLRPVMTLKAPIIAIREIEAGDTVGYNRRWTASRKSTIATVAIGYGDGYPRHAPSGTPVLIGSQQASLVGTVSMDMIGIDISDCQGVAIGDDVTLWGEALPAEQIARLAGTIPYHLLTGVTSRVNKIYHSG